MTRALRFSSEEALRVALTSGLVGPGLASAPVRGWRSAEGEILVAPNAALSAPSLEALQRDGVVIVDVTIPDGALAARCWAELVALRPHGTGAIADRVLFSLPDARTLLELAGELLRLGCDRQALRRAGDGFLLRAMAPSYFTVLRALDRKGGVRAFTASPEGQDRVWVELGHEHPLASLLRPEANALLLLSPDRPWVSVPDGAWTDLYTVADLSVPGEAHDLEARDEEGLPRLAISMRLVRGGHDEAPTLWVLRRDAINEVERLLASSPDAVAQGLLYAVSDEAGSDTTQPVVILRARPSARGLALELVAETYRPHLQIPNLFLPCGAALEPPLRRDKVRELFAPDPDAVTWVSGMGRELSVMRIDEDAFRPLDEWVEYVVDRDAEVLRPWIEGATFAFSELVVEEVASPAPSSRHAPQKARARERAAAPEVAFVPAAVGVTSAPVSAAPSKPASTADDAVLLAKLAGLERELLAQKSAPDDPARAAVWSAMADLNARLGRANDAALCWTRALWDATEGTPEIARTWARTEAGAREITSMLTISAPSRDDVRAVAALVTLAGLEARANLDTTAVALWLDRHDAALDLRTLWLARSSLSRMAGHDVLALARARDVIFQRLHRGVSIERDVPTFLRLLGGARDAAQVQRLATCVDGLLERFRTTKRASSLVEASSKLTLAYVLFVCAYGLARLGQAERAREHVERATKLLPMSDAIHGLLVAAFSARVAQALEGLPPEAPLPADVNARLAQLEKLDRYKVDRVRQSSQILEPQERLDPILAFQIGARDPRGPEFEELRGKSDVPAIAEVLARIVSGAQKSKPMERARLFDGAMDFFPMLPADDAATHVRTILASIAEVPPSRRVELLEEALMLAGHAGDHELAREVFGPLHALVVALDAEGVADAARVLGASLRTLRRAGLRDEAAMLLDAMRSSAEGPGIPALVARVHAGAALVYLGRFEEARTPFDEALAVLARQVSVPERLDLTRALARAVGSAPEEYALAALGKMGDGLAFVTDAFNTNSHVCVSVLSFVESLVLGYASDDLTMGELGRQWLDDDEYLIRRRIHRDMSRT